MKNTMGNGRQIIADADIAQSTFSDVNLKASRFENANMAETHFEDINMGGTTFHNINMSDISITAAQLGGATFRHIGLPDGSSGQQRPITFSEADLNGSSFNDCNLSNARIANCNTKCMTIDGIALEDLLAAYRQQTP